jgi:hypothetical protein
MLIAAPELAVLALLQENLRVVGQALLAAQPALLGEPPSWKVTTELRAAARVLRDATRLARSLEQYRRRILETIHDEAEDEHDGDVPF